MVKTKVKEVKIYNFSIRNLVNKTKKAIRIVIDRTITYILEYIVRIGNWAREIENRRCEV